MMAHLENSKLRQGRV